MRIFSTNPPHPKTRVRAATLVVTLLVLALMSSVIVAFMQSVTLERNSSDSYTNRYRAELAVEAGLNDALAIIDRTTASDDFTVLAADATLSGATFPVNYIGVPQANAIKYYPLFSGGSEITGDDGAGIPINQMPTADQAFQTPPTDIAVDQLPLLPHITLGGTRNVNVAWIPIRDQNGDTIAKYAFWAEDLGAYIDADAAGAKPLVRDDGSGADELGVFTLFRPDEKVDSNPEAPDRELIENRLREDGGENFSLLASTKTLGFLGITDGYDAEGNYDFSNDFQKFFATNLGFIDEPEMVPRGLNYANAEEPKKNLNPLIETGGEESVTEIANWIDANLPDFNQRGGGFPPTQNYTKTIAANIIDYADDDNDATVGADYRGVDNYPFLTQFYQQFTWVNNLGAGVNPWEARGGTWQALIRWKLHVQLWNPSNQPIESGDYNIDLSTFQVNGTDVGQRYAAFFSGSEIFQFFDLPPGTPPFTISFSNANQLRPNGYIVWSSNPVDWWLDSGISITQPKPNLVAGGKPIISDTGGPPVSAGSFNETAYQITWNGNLVDRPGAISHNQSRSFESRRMELDPSTSAEGPSWRGGQPSLRKGGFPNPYSKLLGDPRGSFYVSEQISALNYAQHASWWGRHSVPPTSSLTTDFTGAARLHSWPDGAHETLPGYSVEAIAPGTTAAAMRTKNSFEPTLVPEANRPPIEETKAPSRISNEGRFLNILELGNVFDPICWRPNFGALADDDLTELETAWLNMGKTAGSMVSDANYVAPSTLRIGRTEYFPFQESGKRATQLLDLFTVNPTTSTKGKININTASRDVLRALGAGILITSDPDIMPDALQPDNGEPTSGLSGPYIEKQADKLADAIIQSRPFLTTSQLANINLDDQPFFGNPEMWDDVVPERWNDSAREEYFRKLFPLTSVRNRNFRIFVTGVALNPRTGNVISKSSKVYQVFIEPEREDGEIASQKIKIVSENEI